MNLIGFCVFVRTAGVHAATCRMFAPLFFGIPEESATGMAAGPLVASLVDLGMATGPEIRILQGEFMVPSQPSEIVSFVETKDSRVLRLRVGSKTSSGALGQGSYSVESE